MKQCERLNVSPKWTKLKTIVSNLKKTDYDFHISQETKSIEDYVTRSDIERKIPNIRNITADDPLLDMGCELSWKQLISALENKPWLEDLAKWVRYYEVGALQRFFWHYQFKIVFPNHPQGGLTMYYIRSASEMMAINSLLGWKDAVVQQGYMNIAALNRGYETRNMLEYEHRRAQAFMLRLFCDWVGDVSHRWPSYAYDEPIYEALIQHWRTPNPEDLVPCLLAACDRHTHQTGRDSSKNFYDFSIPALMRVPIEILFLFRLREWEGLTNPTFDHPLMAAPFDKLPETQPIPELDALMQGVLKRAREDWPNYDEVLSLSNLKKIIQ